jgi:4-hydroxy-4-methyl-2-oxoglutarate aldolase
MARLFRIDTIKGYMPTLQSSPAELALLSQYDTPTICNVIELFHIRPRTAGYMDSRIHACFPDMPPVVGYASTATFRAAFAPAEGSTYKSLDEQVRAFELLPGPPIVVFQDLDDPPVAATFGEIMCATYQAFGAAALITSGAARDLLQVRALGFPVFSNGAICSHGYSHTLTIHEPVRVGGIAVQPGDLLHADANGVTTIPVEIASDVAHTAAEFVAAEAVILDYLKAGTPNPTRFAEARRECQQRIVELSERVRFRGASERQMQAKL